VPGADIYAFIFYPRHDPQNAEMHEDSEQADGALARPGTFRSLIQIGVWRATLIQRARHLDSIVVCALLVAEFFDSIGQ